MTSHSPPKATSLGDDAIAVHLAAEAETVFALLAPALDRAEVSGR
ncbi:hypothetical protein GCM10027589_29970 [Actinocorallia lasiicapitis]